MTELGEEMEILRYKIAHLSDLISRARRIIKDTKYARNSLLLRFFFPEERIRILKSLPENIEELESIVEEWKKELAESRHRLEILKTG